MRRTRDRWGVATQVYPRTRWWFGKTDEIREWHSGLYLHPRARPSSELVASTTNMPFIVRLKSTSRAYNEDSSKPRRREEYQRSKWHLLPSSPSWRPRTSLPNPLHPKPRCRTSSTPPSEWPRKRKRSCHIALTSVIIPKGTYGNLFGAAWVSEPTHASCSRLTGGRLRGEGRMLRLLDILPFR